MEEAVAPVRGVGWRSFAIVGVVAGALAGAVNLGLAWGLSLPEGSEAEAVVTETAPPVVPPSARNPKLSEPVYLSAILGRNLFDPAAIGKDEEGEEGEGGIPALAIKLRGTIVVVPAAYSAAFIEEDGKANVWAYGIGQTVQGAEIVAIERDRILVRRGATEEWVEVGGRTTEAERPAASGEGGEGGVTADSETSFSIERRMLDEKLADLASLQKEARALLHRGPDGEYDGYRLSAIRRGSMLDSLGVKNGDIIHSVNGLPLTSVDGAMKALEQLRSDSSFKIEVTRRGQPVSLDYAVK
jgi:general secretion pathway protein C